MSVEGEAPLGLSLDTTELLTCLTLSKFLLSTDGATVPWRGKS